MLRARVPSDQTHNHGHDPSANGGLPTQGRHPPMVTLVDAIAFTHGLTIASLVMALSLSVELPSNDSK